MEAVWLGEGCAPPLRMGQKLHLCTGKHLSLKCSSGAALWHLTPHALQAALTWQYDAHGCTYFHCDHTVTS
eukprot:364976-Chlamydomonas_euryale.AAC.10